MIDEAHIFTLAALVFVYGMFSRGLRLTIGSSIVRRGVAVPTLAALYARRAEDTFEEHAREHASFPFELIR